jgi:hypothetical protein
MIIMSDSTLCSENIHGNIHDAVRSINQRDLQDYVIHMSSLTGRITVVVYRIPNDSTIRI